MQHMDSKMVTGGFDYAERLLNGHESEGHDVYKTPMIDRAKKQIDEAKNESIRNFLQGPNAGLDFTPSGQAVSLLTTIERSLKDIYEWACENQKENQGLLYDLNTAIAAVERCGVKIKDGR